MDETRFDKLNSLEKIDLVGGKSADGSGSPEQAPAPDFCPKCGLVVSGNTYVCPSDGTPIVPNAGGDLKLSDKYEFLSKLSEGGMGAVYRVRHKMLDQEFAIKILHAHMRSPIGFKRFRREAQTTLGLRHPGIVAVHDFGISDQGQAFIAMDLAHGRTLSQIIKAKTSLPLKAVLNLFEQLCEAMSYAHSKGVVHRDIKPSNIIVEEREDGSLFGRILDFGIARVADNGGETLTTTGEVFGSPAYMSPEQCNGQQPDIRSDIYSLGCTLFETLTKHPPFSGANPLEIVYKQGNVSAPRLSDVCELVFPESLEDLVNKALAKDRDERFATMGEFEDALKKVTEDEPSKSKSGSKAGKKSGAHRTANERNQSSSAQDNAIKAALIAIPLILILGGTAALIYMGMTHSSSAPQYKVGQSLEANWNGKWYPVTVISTNGGKTKIHYTDYGAEWDEWVGPDRLHTVGTPSWRSTTTGTTTSPYPGPIPTPPQENPFDLLKGVTVGDQIEAEWHGKWYPCTLLRIEGGNYRIHYEGYDDSYDEWISMARLRKPTSSDAGNP